jgi:hypothetical protein
MQWETTLVSGKIAVLAALMLSLSAGAGFAQTDDPSFYTDPMLPDPPLTVAHPYRAPVATADVAAVAPAVMALPPLQHPTACTALNPCAVTARAAR